MSQSVTLKDVALLAGVSPSTVSRVLNGQSNARPETEQRILAAAARLNFHPNALAKSLVTGRSHLVGVLADRGAGRWSQPVLVGAITRFAESEVATLLRDANADQALRDSQVRALDARRIDGVLVVGAGHFRPYASVTDRFSVPVVYAHDLSSSSQDRCVVPDNELAGRLAGEHLIGLGRRRIGCVSAEMSQAAHDRLRGLTAVLEQAGLQLIGGPRLGSWTLEWGEHATANLLTSVDDLDAIVCGNDAIAYGARDALTRAGLRVPDDVALVGHDNWESYLGPRRFLTTIDPRLAEIGDRAAQRLTRAIDRTGDDEPALERVAGTIVIGTSTIGDGVLGDG